MLMVNNTAKDTSRNTIRLTYYIELEKWGLSVFGLSDYTGSMENWNLIRGWLDDCFTNHVSCNDASPINAWYPTRLLYLGHAGSAEDADIRLIKTAETPELLTGRGYVTLSHCWGKAECIKLLHSNFASLLKSLPLSKLPKTFIDAVTISRNTGQYLLWIDALCIIQDSQDDWRREGSTMHEVYRRATFTISADDSLDSTGGCLFSRQPLALEPFSSTWVNMATNVKHKYYFFSRGQDPSLPIHHRAWVFQERLMSPRTLCCTKKQLIWVCKQHVVSEMHPKGDRFWKESGQSTWKNRHEFHKLMVSLHQNMKTALHVADAHLSKQVYEQLPKLWGEVVEEYTALELTYPEDKLVAISAIAAYLSPALGQYCAGLWRNTLLQELLW